MRALRLSGWPNVEAALLAPEYVCPDHWRHVHNRLTTGLDPRAYTELRHAAWLKRHVVTA